MTVVAGFVNPSVVVLAADSREVISDYSKRRTKKIRVYENATWRIGIAGSSDHSAYLDLFEQELVDKLRIAQETDGPKLFSLIKGTVHQIHKQHIWPRRWDRPSIQMLIAVQSLNPEDGAPSLIVTEDSAVLRVSGYRCVGIGQHMADYLAKAIFPFDDDIRESPPERLVNAGVFLIREVKKAIHGCDDETNVAVFSRNGEFKFCNMFELAMIDNWLTTLAYSNAQLFKAVVNPHMDEDKFLKAWEGVKQQIENLRKGQIGQMGTGIIADIFTPSKDSPLRKEGVKRIRPSVPRKSKGRQ
ncbi:MAG: hypothetical protein ABSB39_18700 [Candidatus Sulfotelmatobacter sp.]|jgi:20S proteasome alpha/beta subunit